MADYIKDVYARMNRWAFWTTLLFSIGLFIASFMVPPLGTISPSVLTAVSEMLGFCTLGTVMHGISRGADVHFTKGETSIKVDNPDNKEK